VPEVLTKNVQSSEFFFRPAKHPAVNPFDFVLDQQFAHLEIDCELSEDSKRSREAYARRLRLRFVKFPYLIGMTIARECNCPILAMLLELMWESFSHKNKNPVVYSTAVGHVANRLSAAAAEI
jgi:hypothetical protein